MQFANPSASREIGYTQQELMGRALGLLFEDPAQWEALWRSIVESQKAVRPVELVARRKDGSKSYLEISASRWLSAGHVFVTAILRDVSERHAAEEALRNLNSTLERRVAERTQERDQVWRVSRDMLGVAATDGKWISVNPAWKQILGWLPEDLLGKTSDWLAHPDELQRKRDEFCRLAATEMTFSFENSLRARSGEYRVFPDRGQCGRPAVLRGARHYRAKETAGGTGEGREALRQSQKMEAVVN